jgi:hypothetical protein
MTLSYAPYPQAVAGSLGDVGLGALTYPSWIPQKCVNCSDSTLARWKTQIAFAMGWYDIFRNLEKFPDPAQAERFKRFGTYGKPELAMDPNNAFWASTPERVADHADIVKQALRHGSFHTSTSFTPVAALKTAVKAIEHAPVMTLVNPADALVHKIVGDKVYYAVAKAIGGDKVEAALKAGNNSLADLSKGKTRAELVSQGVAVAKTAVAEKLTPEQVQAVLASLPPETAQAARDALAGKTPSASAPAAPAAAPAPAQLRTLDPPKRVAAPPAPAAPAKAPLKTLDPPKRATAPASAASAKAAPAVQAASATPGAAFTYAPYPRTGLSGPEDAVLNAPPHGGHGHGGGGHGGHGGHGGGHARSFARGGGGSRWWGVPWNYEVVTTVETCRTWGDPVDMMPVEMLTAARTVLGTSGGRPTTVRGPDGVLYLIALEGKSVTARPCAAVATS